MDNKNELSGIPVTKDNETHWDLLPKKLRKKIQQQYQKQLKKPSNAGKTSGELMDIVGEKMNIKFDIEA